MEKRAYAGFGLKPLYFSNLEKQGDKNFWLEIHTENYLYDQTLRKKLIGLRQDRAISLHGVGASLGGPDALDLNHLQACRSLIDEVNPFLVSEHLSWSKSAGIHYHDLLPIPRNEIFLNHVSDRIDQFQNAIDRRILIENPSAYLGLRHEIDEPEFLTRLCQKTGCGLLIDVNNIYVSAHNLKLDADEWLSSIPGSLVGEIHLAGHENDYAQSDGDKVPVLIDTHGIDVAEPVWRLYQSFIARIGPRPTLVERDNNLPSFEDLMIEVQRAQDCLDQCQIIPMFEPHTVGMAHE